MGFKSSIKELFGKPIRYIWDGFWGVLFIVMIGLAIIGYVASLVAALLAFVILAVVASIPAFLAFIQLSIGVRFSEEYDGVGEFLEELG